MHWIIEVSTAWENGDYPQFADPVYDAMPMKYGPLHELTDEQIDLFDDVWNEGPFLSIDGACDYVHAADPDALVYIAVPYTTPHTD